MTDPKAPEADFAERLRTWRRVNRIKQEWLASQLGVTQAAVSRWESGADRPRRQHMGRLVDVIQHSLAGTIEIESRFISAQSGISSLVRYDGMRLLAVSKGFRELWPEFSRLVGIELGDELVNEAAEVCTHPDYRNGVHSGAIAMMSGVSRRHTTYEMDGEVRHRWHVCFRRQGPLVLAEMVYEPCSQDLPTGIDMVVNLDTVSSTI